MRAEVRNICLRFWELTCWKKTSYVAFHHNPVAKRYGQLGVIQAVDLNFPPEGFAVDAEGFCGGAAVACVMTEGSGDMLLLDVC